MKLRIIVREDNGSLGPSFRTFDIPLTPELLVHLTGQDEPPIRQGAVRTVIGAEQLP